MGESIRPNKGKMKSNTEANWRFAPAEESRRLRRRGPASWPSLPAGYPTKSRQTPIGGKDQIPKSHPIPKFRENTLLPHARESSRSAHGVQGMGESIRPNKGKMKSATEVKLALCASGGIPAASPTGAGILAVVPRASTAVQGQSDLIRPILKSIPPKWRFAVGWRSPSAGCQQEQAGSLRYLFIRELEIRLFRVVKPLSKSAD